MIVSLAALWLTAQAGPMVISRGDSTIITDGKDTVTVVADLNGLKAKVNGILNDTLLKLGTEGAEVQEENGQVADEVTTAEEEAALERRYSAQYNLQNSMGNVARDIVSYCLTALVIIVLLSLLFYYLHRRRKYKMVEKAIQNNYPLPPYIFGGSRETVRTVYVNPPTVATPPVTDGVSAPDVAAQPSSSQPQPASAAVPGTGVINWGALKGGFTMAVVGFGGMLFFLMAGAEPLAGAAAILILLGLGKMWIAYQEQRTLAAYVPPVPPTQPEAPASRPSAVEPDVPVPPVFQQPNQPQN